MNPSARSIFNRFGQDFLDLVLLDLVPVNVRLTRCGINVITKPHTPDCTSACRAPFGVDDSRIIRDVIAEDVAYVSRSFHVSCRRAAGV